MTLTFEYDYDAWKLINVLNSHVILLNASLFLYFKSKLIFTCHSSAEPWILNRQINLTDE